MKTIGTVTTVAGVELTVKKDKHHFRAYDKDGKQHGEAWIDCENLANELRFKIPDIVPAPERCVPPAPAGDGGPDKPNDGTEPIKGQQMGSPRDCCGYFNQEACRMDNTACDGKCGEHASRAIETAPSPEESKSEQEDPGKQDDGHRPNIEG